jgi:hypothetical protein
VNVVTFVQTTKKSGILARNGIKKWINDSVEIIVFHNVLGGFAPATAAAPLRYPSKTGSSWISGINVRSGISTEPGKLLF